MIKVVDEGLIVGLITETYQFVQINPPEENTIMDDLRVLYNTNFNQVDRVLATHKRPDMERVNTIKNIQLETNFYSMFRSSMRKLITSNREIRAKLIDVIESKTLLYKQKIEGVLSLLTETYCWI
jgi:hypothetical protein